MDNEKKTFFEHHAEEFTSFLGKYMASKLIFGFIFKWILNILILYVCWHYLLKPALGIK
jgi:hypothetical protein